MSDNVIVIDDVEDYIADEGIDLKKSKEHKIGFV